jgi:hypothetical protein
VSIIPDIIEIIDKEPRVSHVDIAKYTDNKIKSVQDLITRNLRNLEEFGNVIVLNRKEVNKGKGEQPKIYFLNEAQLNFIFIIAKLPLKLSILFARYSSSLKALEEFSKIEKKPKNYFVYVIDFENASLKIGFTSSPQKRLRTLETQSGNKILDKEIIEFSSKQEALTYEKFLHNKFADFRTRGEYFAIKFDVILNFVRNSKNCLEQKST